MGYLEHKNEFHGWVVVDLPSMVEISRFQLDYKHFTTLEKTYYAGYNGGLQRTHIVVIRFQNNTFTSVIAVVNGDVITGLKR